MADRAFQRVCEVRVGLSGSPGRMWTQEMAIEFEVKHDHGKWPNQAEVTISNLSDDSVGWIERPGNILQLYAGYGFPQLLFHGHVRPREVRSTWSGTERRTRLIARDGGIQFAESDFYAGYEGAVTVRQVALDIASAMGLGIEHIDPELADVQIYGSAFLGPARAALDHLLDGTGARWSIQDGRLIILGDGAALPPQAYVLSSDSGMIGSPERTDKGLKVTAVLIPQLRPGRLVAIESRDVRGFFKIDSLVHVGATQSDTWQTQMEVRPV